ncbi:hypothetical protein F4780DRAFT_782042 [Xylariomycetidae sp. FL0641]|nr:hypothetical protein F4780DRAFT_782042 [Xylariomycetidae sp. FL0641]
MDSTNSHHTLASFHTDPPDATELMKLPDVIFWEIARYHLPIEDINNLSRTCSRLYQLLDPLLYRSAVLHAVENSHPFTYDEETLIEWGFSGRRQAFSDWDRGIGERSLVSSPYVHNPISLIGCGQDDTIALAVIQKCVTAALKYAPRYLTLHDGWGKPLVNAAEYSEPVVVRILLEAYDSLGFGPESRQKQQETPKTRAIGFDLAPTTPSPDDFEIYNRDILFSLLAALRMKRLDVSMWLVEHMGHINDMCPNVYELLHQAICDAAVEKMAPVIRKMHELGYHSVLDRLESTPDPLTVVASRSDQEGSSEIMDLLIELEMFAGNQEDAVKAAFETACYYGGPQIAEHLCNYLKSPHLGALHHIFDGPVSPKDKFLGIIEKLLDSLPEADEAYRGMLSELAIAFMYRHDECPLSTIFLVNHDRVDLTLPVQREDMHPNPWVDLLSRETPLVSLTLGDALLLTGANAWRARVDVIQELLKAGHGVINLNAVDSCGMSALQLAKYSMNKKVEDLLRARGAHD